MANTSGSRTSTQRPAIFIPATGWWVSIKALTASGLDATKLFARAQEPEVKAKLIENTQSAVERGAFGSPTFFVGKEMFFGKEQLREVEELVSAK